MIRYVNIRVMIEYYDDDNLESRRIYRQKIELNNGPYELELGDHKLNIVSPRRDLLDYTSEADYIIVDPKEYNADNKGFIAIQDCEYIELGRDRNYGRFNFSLQVSRDHVLLMRKGNQLDILDLGSTNGTYLKKLAWQSFAEQINTTNGRNRTYHEGLRIQSKLGSLSIEEAAYNPTTAGYSIASNEHPGRNEDAFFVQQNSIGVFDGVGSMSRSDLASELAATISKKHLNDIPSKVPRRLSHLALYEAIFKAHEDLIKKADNKEIDQLLTTATVAKIFETDSGSHYAAVASAGDTRAYLYRNKSLTHLTLDHAYRMPGHSEDDARSMQITLSEVKDLSKLTSEEYAAFSRRHIISSYLGGRLAEPTVTVQDFEVFSGDRILITSDGIHDNSTNGEIECLIGQAGSAETAVQSLVEHSFDRSMDVLNKRAKADDMTAAAIFL
jgi:serine/threonine protein phosphatase PrpC